MLQWYHIQWDCVLTAQTLSLSLLVNSAHVLSQLTGFKKLCTSEIGQGFDLLHRNQERKKNLLLFPIADGNRRPF